MALRCLTRTGLVFGFFSSVGKRLSQWLLGPTSFPRSADNWRDVGSGFLPITSMK